MNALHLCFGIGAFLCPLIVDRFAVATDDATDAYFLFAALMVPVAIWLTRVPSPDSPTAQQWGSVVVRRYFFLGLMGLLFFMHVGAGWPSVLDLPTPTGGHRWIHHGADAQLGVLGGGRAAPPSLSTACRGPCSGGPDGSAGFLALIGLPRTAPALWIGTIGFGMAIASVFATINYAEQRISRSNQAWRCSWWANRLMTLPGWPVSSSTARAETLIWLVECHRGSAGAVRRNQTLRPDTWRFWHRDEPDERYPIPDTQAGLVPGTWSYS
jgi:hypothetical protein